MSCANCFTPIGDARSAKQCQTCEKPLHKDCAINDDGTFCDVCYTVRGEEKPSIDFELPEEIRRTYIETYRTCPHKFLLEVIQGNAQPPTIYTQLGIDLHDWFDASAHNPSIDANQITEDMRTKFVQYEKDGLLEGFSFDKFWKRCTTSIDTYFHIKEKLPATPFITEETIRFSIGEGLPLVRFTMDRIDEVDGELELLDWKTGKVMVGQKLSSDLQAPLYIAGTIKHFNKPVRKFTFYYVNENKERTFERTADDPNVYVCQVNKRKYYINLQDCIRELQSIFNQVKKGNFGIPQNVSKLRYVCKMCHLQEQGLCRGADEESWYQNTNKGW